MCCWFCCLLLAFADDIFGFVDGTGVVGNIFVDDGIVFVNIMSFRKEI